MNSARIFSLIATISGLSLLIFSSGQAMADPAVPRMDDIIPIMLAIIMGLNVPFNLFLYLGFIHALVLYPNDDEPELFSRSPGRFIGIALGIVLLASFIGAVVDVLMFVVVFHFNPVFLLAIGLAAIFLSFFIPAIYVQELKVPDAARVALGITVSNIFFWFALGIFQTSIMVFIGLGLAILLLFLPWSYNTYKRHHLRFFPGGETI